jgi:hypothetical protein
MGYGLTNPILILNTSTCFIHCGLSHLEFESELILSHSIHLPRLRVFQSLSDVYEKDVQLWKLKFCKLGVYTIEDQFCMNIREVDALSTPTSLSLHLTKVQCPITFEKQVDSQAILENGGCDCGTEALEKLIWYWRWTFWAFVTIYILSQWAN